MGMEKSISFDVAIAHHTKLLSCYGLNLIGKNTLKIFSAAVGPGVIGKLIHSNNNLVPPCIPKNILCPRTIVVSTITCLETNSRKSTV